MTYFDAVTFSFTSMYLFFVSARVLYDFAQFMLGIDGDDITTNRDNIESSKL